MEGAAGPATPEQRPAGERRPAASPYNRHWDEYVIEEDVDEFPIGWEMRHTTAGRPYYVDHINRGIIDLGVILAISFVILGAVLLPPLKSHDVLFVVFLLMADWCVQFLMLWPFHRKQVRRSKIHVSSTARTGSRRRSRTTPHCRSTSVTCAESCSGSVTFSSIRRGR